MRLPPPIFANRRSFDNAGKLDSNNRVALDSRPTRRRMFLGSKVNRRQYRRAGRGNSVEELVYLLKWNSEDELKEKMGAFLKDPRWLEARDKSEANCKLAVSFASKDLNPVCLFREMK
jgi:hypothetical protein